MNRKIKILSILFSLVLVLTACTGGDDGGDTATYETQADGYGGPVEISTTFDGEEIKEIERLF